MLNLSLTDQEIMNDINSSQKHISGIYNSYASECANEKLRDDMLCILREEHNIQSSIFTEMEKRGWYAPPAAEQQKIDQAKTKFQGISQSL